MKFFLKYTLLNAWLLLKDMIRAPFSREARHRLSAVYSTLRYPFFGHRLTDLSTLLRDPQMTVTLPAVKAGMHNTDPFEMLSICSLLKDNQSAQVFEIGTFDGRTTRAMAMNLTGDGAHIYTLNLPPEAAEVALDTSDVDVQLAAKVTSGAHFIGTPEQEKITQVWGDSARFDFSPWYGSLDFVFIDGAHSEDYVRNDTREALKMIRPEGGVIVWHDAHLFGVVKFLAPWVRDNNLDLYFIRHTSLAVARVQQGKVSPWPFA